MQFFLAVDGGGSGCRVRLADAAGQTLATAGAGPANIATNPAAALENILTASRQVLAASGLGPSQVAAGLGLAGANVAGTTDWLAARLPFGRARIASDALTTALGALAGQDGIVAAIGTGAVFAVIREGRFRQIGGHGFVLGDGGSGAVLGRMLLAAALRADDGLTALTPLLAEVLARHGGAEALHAFAHPADPAAFARLAPLVLASADPAAEQIRASAGAEITAHIDCLQAGGTTPLPVVWAGGLGPAWAGAIGARWPQRPPAGTALDGAMQLARDTGATRI